MFGNDPWTDAIIAFISVRNALMIGGVYGLVLAAYLVDELGYSDFPRWYSRVTLSLFTATSPVFILLAMLFAFMWGFSA